MNQVNFPTEFPPEARLYFNQMVEVKRRLTAIDRILGAKKGTSRTLSQDTDNEFGWLQVRKIIELVTYSAIASDFERYSALRALTNGRVEDDQHAKKILNRLSGLNPKFLPLPQGAMVVQPDGAKHFEGLDEVQQATLERFSDLFDEASEHLHSANPFVPEAQLKERNLRQASRDNLIRARDYMKVALWSHYKMGLEFKTGDDPRVLDNFKTVYLVNLNKPDQENITMHLATRKNDY